MLTTSNPKSRADLASLKRATQIKTILPRDLLRQLAYLEQAIAEVKAAALDHSAAGRDVNYAPAGTQIAILQAVDRINRFKLFQ